MEFHLLELFCKFKFHYELFAIIWSYQFSISDVTSEFDIVTSVPSESLINGEALCIARALYRNPKVLIFDEATSALDNLTEKTIIERINRLKHSITLIMIAHRLSTIKNCDKIYHLENGKLRSHGTFNELLKNDELFRNMSSNFL